MDYLKLFQTHEEYEAFVSGGTMVKPNVSHCVSENEVHYNPRTWADEYFTTVARENGTISFNIWKKMGTDMIKSISYSTDNGETWATINNTDNKTANLVIDVGVNNGDKVMWKGDVTQLGYYDEYDYDEMVGSFFSSTCEFDAQGNVMSLLYGDNFKSETTIENNYAFCSLFYDYDGENTCGIINAKNLSLPATTLADGCYQYMFQGCRSLTTAPELTATTLAIGCYECMFAGCESLITAPELTATTLAIGCYNNMFNGCTSLTTAPELPATTLANYCYSHMFYNCTSLTTAPALPATTLADYCYQGMFYNCTSLTTAPELPATTLAEYCYSRMFYGCSSLTTAPELPATTLADNCYNNMFNGCTSLTTAPELPATTLASQCYVTMFYNCTSLTTAPELPATTLASDCYGSMFGGCTSLVNAPELPATTLEWSCYSFMFYNCTSLNYIKCLATDISAASCTQNWVSGVASSGTFIKAASMTGWTTGVNGIPTNWTVQNAS